MGVVKQKDTGVTQSTKTRDEESPRDNENPAGVEIDCTPEKKVKQMHEDSARWSKGRSLRITGCVNLRGEW